MGSNRSDLDVDDDDDDFSDIYKEYTGPMSTTTTSVKQPEEAKPIQQSEQVRDAEQDEEEEPLHDPYSVPTDFTSREAKVWEAKSKATERNWKKRKEEELICKICGESGHFTQGCPSTLGVKSQEFLERIPARDKNVRVLFTDKVIERIETETGCKIKMDDKFIIVSGKDRLILRKGVDAVHKIKGDGEMKSSPASQRRSRSRSPRRTSVGPPRARNSEPQIQYTPSHGSSSFSERSATGRQDKFVENRFREENRIREDHHRGSPQAYGSERARSRSTHSKSPGRPRYSGWDKPYDRQKPEVSSYNNNNRSERWENQERTNDIQQVSYHSERERPVPFPQTLEELEVEYTRDAMELEKKRDKEEDEENNRHRQTIRELRESYMKKLVGLREVNAKRWEEFLQVDHAYRRQQQQARQQEISTSLSSYGGNNNNYRQFPPNDGGYSTNPPPPPPPSYGGGNNVPIDTDGRYPNHVKNYPSRHQDNSYSTTGFQRQRRDNEYGKGNRY